MAPPETSVLFVCLGNICRSPMAEAVFRHAVTTSPLARRIHCDSAGTAGHHQGEAPHRSTLAVLRENGIATEHRARQVTREDFLRFDLLLAMDQANFADLRAAAPRDARAEIVLFRSFDPSSPAGAEVPDPWGYPMASFREVYTLCTRASEGLLRHLTAERREQL